MEYVYILTLTTEPKLFGIETKDAEKLNIKELKNEFDINDKESLVFVTDTPLEIINLKENGIED